MASQVLMASMDDDHAYRAMDLLVDADTQGQAQEAVFFVVANLRFGRHERQCAHNVRHGQC